MALLADDPDRISRKDAQDCYKGETPLHWASQHGHLNVAELLVAKKAEVNAKDDKGDTPLHSAAKYDHKDVAEFLLANKADVNAQNNSGNMPLHAAAGFKDIVELLLSNKAEVSARGNGGTTPLHTAVEAVAKTWQTCFLPTTPTLMLRTTRVPPLCISQRNVEITISQNCWWPTTLR